MTIKTPVRYGLGMLMNKDGALVCVMRMPAVSETYPKMDVELGEYIATAINAYASMCERIKELEEENNRLRQSETMLP
jgi:hypothetical protein